MIGLDPTAFDPDAPLPDELLDGPPPSERRRAGLRGSRDANGSPLRELARAPGRPAEQR